MQKREKKCRCICFDLRWPKGGVWKNKKNNKTFAQRAHEREAVLGGVGWGSGGGGRGCVHYRPTRHERARQMRHELKRHHRAEMNQERVDVGGRGVCGDGVGGGAGGLGWSCYKQKSTFPPLSPYSSACWTVHRITQVWIIFQTLIKAIKAIKHARRSTMGWRQCPGGLCAVRAGCDLFRSECTSRNEWWSNGPLNGFSQTAFI